MSDGTAEIFTPQTDETDGSLYIGTLATDNLPFCIKVVETDINPKWVSMLGVYDIVLLDLDGEEVHPLDEKYLPDLRSDWTQNDSAAKDYIKNRTHYIERAEKQYPAWTGERDTIPIDVAHRYKVLVYGKVQFTRDYTG